MSHVASKVTKTPAAAEASEAVIAKIRTLLGSQQFMAAQREATMGASAFPSDPWIRRADKVLNPGKASRVPSRGPTRTAEFEWLRRNSEEYRGQWVALHGAKLLAAGENLEVVLEDLRAHHRDLKPLVHRVV